MTAKTLLLFVLLGCWTGLTLAGDPDSVLVADTVWVGSASGEPGTHIMIPVTGKNTFPYAAMEVPLIYRLSNGESPVVCDSIRFNGCRTEYFECKVANLSLDTTDHKLCIYLVASLSGQTPPLQPGAGLWANVYFTVKSNAQPCTVSIDSTRFPPTAQLAVFDTVGTGATPQYVPGRIIVLPGNGIEAGKPESTVYEGGYKARPNPFVSFFTIPGHEGKSFALFDITGKQVGAYRGDRIGERLLPGVYFVKAEGWDARLLRIVKVR